MKKEMICGVVLALLIIVTGVEINGVAQTPSTDSQQQTPPVTNKTTAIQVISLIAFGPVAPVGQPAKLVMKNVSTKEIISYSIGYNTGGSITSDMTTGAPPIAPGNQFKVELLQAVDIVIRDVIFEDGSIDGDVAAAQEQFDRWDGMREQFERIYLFLNASPPPADIEQLKALLRALPIENSADRSYFVTAGLRNVKDEVLLDVLRFDRANFQSELAKLNERVTKQLQRLARRS